MTSPPDAPLDDTVAAEDGAEPSARRPQPRPLVRGAAVGRYVVLSKLGAGGMGVVYAAYDPELDRRVALKLLLPSGHGYAAQARLQREAQALAKVSHPNVVNVHDVGTKGESVYVAMEFVEGQTVTRWLAERDPTWREIVDVFVQAGHGLAAAHAEGLLHRDIKPDNLMVDARGRVRVMDFGLARVADPRGSADAPSEGPDPTEPGEPARARDDRAPSVRGREKDSLVLQRRRESGSGAGSTSVGTLSGTPAYMAPEQFEGGEIDARTDLFSYCVSLWEALYGQRPFRGRSLAELAAAVISGERQPVPSRRSVPAWLRRAVEHGLQVDPGQRPPTMHALLGALTRDPGRRRARWVVLGAGGAFAALVLATWMRGEEALCSRAESLREAVWNDARRDELRAAVMDTGLGYASGVWARVEPGVDAWASAWESMHTEACEATRVSGEQSEAVLDLRMACLERARQEFDAALRVLDQATPTVVENAHVVVDALPELARCADVEALQARVPPPDTDEAAAVEAVRADLVRARAHREAGQYDEAAAAIEGARAALEPLRYEPIATEVSVELGTIRRQRGLYGEAEAALRDAMRSGAKHGQQDAIRAAAIELMHVVGHRQQRFDEALALREMAEGLSTGNAEHEHALHNGLALIFEAQGRIEDAQAEQRAALAALRTVLPDDHPRVATSRDHLALVLRLGGALDEAAAEHRAALASLRKTLGDEHPATTTARNNLALVLYGQGDYRSAAEELRGVLDGMRAAVGAQHPDVATAHNNLGQVLYAAGEYEDATAEHRAALALRQRILRPKHPDRAQSRNNLGLALEAQGLLDEAEVEHRAALALLVETVGAAHPNTAQSRSNLARVLMRRRSYAEAETEYRAVLAQQLESVGEAHALVAQAHNDLGWALYEQGRYAEAEAEHRAAVAVFRDAVGEKHPDLAQARNNLANDFLAQGRIDQAEAEHRAALAVRLEAVGEDHPNVALSRTNLAHTLMSKAEPDTTTLEEARRLLDASWAHHERRPGNPARAAKTAATLARVLWRQGHDRERARALARRAATLYRRAAHPERAEAVEAWLRDPEPTTP